LRWLAATADARKAKAATTREQAYLHAVEVLYGDGSKPRRDTLYSREMARIAAANPGDNEAELFFALSLLGLNQGDRDVPTYERAGAIAERVLALEPDNPGAAHYVIHAYDDPAHAERGLAAARAYSKIAPDAAHAQHMTTHIFLALGLWDDVVAQNETAMRVVNEARHHRGAAAAGCGHYNEWLQYGYLQQGRVRDAARVLDQCWASSPPEGVDDIESLAGMRAAYLVDSRDWSGQYAREPKGREPGTRAYLAFGTGFTGAMRGDRPAAEQALAALDSAAALMKGESGTYGKILGLELRGIVLAMRGETAPGLAAVREAVRLDDALPMPFGPPLTVKPPHELLGDMLLAAGQPADAVNAFQKALERAPNRAMALVGLARAARAAGDNAEAGRACAALRTIWHAADDGFVASAASGCPVDAR
jgi:tetratricopeptide (TPR) repeat protein